MTAPRFRGALWTAVAAAVALVLGVIVPSTSGAFTAAVGTDGTVGLNPFLTCAAVVADEQQRGSLVFAYALDDAAGSTSAADASGNGRSGAFTGTMTTSATGAGGCARDGGTAWAPDGSSSGLVSPSVVLRSRFSLELRFRTTQATAALASVRPDQYAATYALALQNGGVALIAPGGGRVVGGGSGYGDGQWHALALVVEDSGLRLYVDGASVDSSAFNMPDGFTVVWRLAFDDDGNSLGLPRFSGAMRAAMLTNRALTASEVKAHDIAGRTPVLGVRARPVATSPGTSVDQPGGSGTQTSGSVSSVEG